MTVRPLAALALIPLLVLTGGLVALRAETSVLFSSGHSFETRVDALSAGQVRPGWSTDARTRLLEQCVDVLIDPRLNGLDFAARQGVLAGCNTYAVAAREATPADALPWTLEALVAARLGLPSGAFAGLAQSRIAAPEEMWIASRRVSIGEMVLEAMSEAERAAHMRDLTLMLSHTAGIEALAPSYFAQAPIRARMVEALEALPPDDQRRFLRVTRRLVRAQQDEAAS